jgi:four helix bundle protein
MARVQNYKDLIAWQKAMALAVAVYRATAKFPASERFGITFQVRKAAVGVPSHIAEGYSRSSKAEYLHYLDIARGSTNEVETQMLLAQRLNFGDADEVQAVIELACEEVRILQGLSDSLRATPNTTGRARR